MVRESCHLFMNSLKRGSVQQLNLLAKMTYSFLEMCFLLCRYVSTHTLGQCSDFSFPQPHFWHSGWCDVIARGAGDPLPH